MIKPLFVKCMAMSLLMACSISGWAAVVGEQVTYQIDGVTYSGYLAYDDASNAKRPGVLVVHEWWGHNDYVRERAEQLAALGYVAFALDMYGEGKLAEHPDDAMRFMSVVTEQKGIAKTRFNAAYEQLSHYALTDKSNIAAIGYCFGGSVVLNMARENASLKGVASFHGGLANSSGLSESPIKPEIMVFNGLADPMVPAQQIADFEQEMREKKATFQVVNYEGAQHGFTNRAADELGKKFNMPLAYNEQADADSWQRLSDFLTEVFAK